MTLAMGAMQSPRGNETAWRLCCVMWEHVQGDQEPQLWCALLLNPR